MEVYMVTWKREGIDYRYGYLGLWSTIDGAIADIKAVDKPVEYNRRHLDGCIEIFDTVCEDGTRFSYRIEKERVR